MNIGLTKEDLDEIIYIFKKFPNVESVVLYGSRAMGNFKKGSDVDLALKGAIDFSSLSSINAHLNEGIPLPYFFDILIYNNIKNESLKEHIDRYGKVIYEKEKN
ncbi:MAG: DNA polymerase III subunit beta [Deltaproteobacteria bacterium RIFCSPHIGHO2_02_FULL_40_11]|nr:MAG: DNA polymerase III subunit beta [Deltaproteobacteria bacterium RIFCSPHIGHO2_02_FULL_40_11]